MAEAATPPAKAKRKRVNLQKYLNHATTFEQILREANDAYSKEEDIPQIIKRLDAEWWGEIQQAHEWTAEYSAENDEAARLCSSYPFVGELLVYLRLPPSERIRWGEAALAAARRIRDRHAEAAHLHKLAMAYIDLGKFQRAIPYLEEGAAINHDIQRLEYEAADLGGLGLACAGLEDHRRAIHFYDEALAIYRVTPDARWGEGIYLSNLAESWRAMGDAPKAIALHQEALKINRDVKDRRSEGYTLGNLGKAYASLGDHERALKTFKESLDVARDSNDQQCEGYSLFETSRSLWALGRCKDAIETAEQALSIFIRIEDFYAKRTRKQLEEWRNQDNAKPALDH
jgi:tetratricopeptide (TPR) repeat protein